MVRAGSRSSGRRRRRPHYLLGMAACASAGCLWDGMGDGEWGSVVSRRQQAGRPMLRRSVRASGWLVPSTCESPAPPSLQATRPAPWPSTQGNCRGCGLVLDRREGCAVKELESSNHLSGRRPRPTPPSQVLPSSEAGRREAMTDRRARGLQRKLLSSGRGECWPACGPGPCAAAGRGPGIGPRADTSLAKLLVALNGRRWPRN